MWDITNAIRAACSNTHGFIDSNDHANTHPTHIHRHTPAHHPNLHTDCRSKSYKLYRCCGTVHG